MDKIYIIAMYKNGNYLGYSESGKNNTTSTFKTLESAKRYKTRLEHLWSNNPQYSFAILEVTGLEVVG